MEDGKYSFEFAETRRCPGGCAHPPKLRTAPPARPVTAKRTGWPAAKSLQRKTETERAQSFKFRFARIAHPLGFGVDREAGLGRFLKDRQAASFAASGFGRLKAMAKPRCSSAFECDQSAAWMVPRGA